MRAAVTVTALLIGLALLWETRVLVLLTVLGALLGIAARSAVDRLEQLHVKRHVGAPLVVFGVTAALAGILLWAGPTLITQVNVLREQVPAAVDKLDVYLSQHGDVLDAVLPRDSTARADSTGALASARLRHALVGQMGSLRPLFFGALTSTLALVGGLVYVLFLTLYTSLEPDVYRRGVLFLVRPERRDRAAEVFDAIIATLRKWLGTQFVAMIVIGLVTTLALLLLGVKAAIPLGLIAGVLEFVPTIGPVLSALPAVLIAFAQSPEKALVVAIAYWAIQFVENNLLIPYLMREQLDLPPALTLLWQAMMALVFGLLGLFVAVPLLAAVYVAMRHLYVRGDVPPPRVPRNSAERLGAARGAA